MKGFMIYEAPLWGNEENVVYLQEVKDASYTLKQIGSDDITCYLEGIATKDPVTKATCNKEDTYDFKTGALIALMKMCGRDKVTKACDELYKDDNYKNALQEVTESFDSLSKKYDLVVEGYDYWKEQCKKLDEENKKLHKNIDELFESDKHAKSEVGRLSFEKHRLEEKVEKLQHEYDLCKNSENALKCSVDYLNKTIAKLNIAIDGYKEDLNKVTKRCRELEVKEDILNKQEEIINKREEEMSVYFGGRGCGKQYKALVELFKKIDKKKIQEAYKEAYGDKVIWCTSQPEVHPLSTAVFEGVSYLTKKFKTSSIDEWLYRIPTKREEMWAEIFALHKESDVIIKVKKEDINAFLHELENKIPEIIWYSGVKIFETKYTIGDIYEELKTCDAIYFRLHKRNKLSYTSDSHIYPYRELKPIDYLPPMRWDLFKKGRLAVKVNYNNRKEFCDACERELGKKPSTYLWDNVTISICKKDGNFEIFTIEHQKKTGRKIVNWEDVR